LSVVLPMTTLTPEHLGYVAGTLTTLAFVPQVLHVYRTRSTKDVSQGMFLMFTTGVALWLLYGIWIASAPVIWTNAVTLMLAGAVLFAKFRWP
jgi:MtN3 and saliva related transmembrane protein